MSSIEIDVRRVDIGAGFGIVSHAQIGKRITSSDAKSREFLRDKIHTHNATAGVGCISWSYVLCVDVIEVTHTFEPDIAMSTMWLFSRDDTKSSKLVAVQLVHDGRQIILDRY